MWVSSQPMKLANHKIHPREARVSNGHPLRIACDLAGQPALNKNNFKKSLL